MTVGGMKVATRLAFACMDANDQKTRITADRAESAVNCPQCGLALARGAAVCPKDGTKVGPQLTVGSPIAAKYKFLEILGEGGMSAVYKAEDPMLNRPVAIKLLHHRFNTDAVVLKRFRQEGQAISQFDHPGIVRVHEFTVLEHGQPCIVMDYVPGQSLADALRAKVGLSLSDSLSIFRQIAQALEHAHARGVLHRDLKPSNVMVQQLADGSWKATLVDFGIAKIVAGATDNIRLTSTGEIIGSPMYMSPEQCQGQQTDVRSDLYSLGCLMYETLSGRPVFHAQSPVEVVFRQVNEYPLPLEQAGPDKRIPQSLLNIVAKLIAKEPDQRFESAASLLAALNQSIDESEAGASGKPLGNRKSFAAVAAVCLVVITGAAFAFFSPHGLTKTINRGLSLISQLSARRLRQRPIRLSSITGKTTTRSSIKWILRSRV